MKHVALVAMMAVGTLLVGIAVLAAGGWIPFLAFMGVSLMAAAAMRVNYDAAGWPDH